MMFSWSRAAYHAFRWAFMGFGIGLALGFVVSLSGGRRDMAFMAAIVLMYVAGFGRLGWELFTKKHPDD